MHLTTLSHKPAFTKCAIIKALKPCQLDTAPLTNFKFKLL